MNRFVENVIMKLKSKLFKFRVITLCFITLWLNGFSQENIPIGAWRNHLAYNKAEIVHGIGDDIYCVVQHGLFRYNLADHSTQKISKIDGLSDITITSFNYQESDNLITIGYDNGNIDLINDNSIENVQDILKANLPYDKKIIDIEFYDNYIYFITGFGVVVYNKDQEAIKETWQNLSQTGEYLEITSGSILQDTLYLSTEKGVIGGDLAHGTNLLDYNNWKRFGLLEGLPEEYTFEIISFNNSLYVIQNDNSVHYYQNVSWKEINIDNQGIFLSLSASDNLIIYTLSDHILLMDKDHESVEVRDGNLFQPQRSILLNEEIWTADFVNGLVHIRDAGSEVIQPSGPFSNDVSRLYNFKSNMVAVPSGHDDTYNPLRSTEGFYYFQEGEWLNYNNTNAYGSIPLIDIHDLVDIQYDQINDILFFASFGYGLMEWDLQDNFILYNEKTPGVTLVNTNPPDPYTMVTAVDMDRSGSLWMTNYLSDIPLHKFFYQDSWQGFNIPISSSAFIVDFIITENNDKWMIVNPGFGGGIIVYNEEGGLSRYLTTEEGYGSLPDMEVTSLAEDSEGRVWVGTLNGIAYFPFQVLQEQNVDAIIPVYNNGYLFKDEKITSIEVDGGNRKWIGTEKGVWLFNEDASELEISFNTENSPILSENLIDIEVNDYTGEVFFATDKGIISYRGNATAPSETHNQVKIFPNPVTPEFTGYVGIEGLPENATIKITDISGKLIYQVKSHGGMATWNVLDYNGQRAATGIYLVFSASSDGTDTFVGKIAIVN